MLLEYLLPALDINIYDCFPLKMLFLLSTPRHASEKLDRIKMESIYFLFREYLESALSERSIDLEMHIRSH